MRSPRTTVVAALAILVTAVLPAPVSSAAPAAAEFMLFVGFEGDGYGWVVSDPEGIECGAPLGCWASFEEGTVVTLTQTTDESSIFLGWSEDCTGTGACQVTMSEDRLVVARYNVPGLFVERLGDGGGQVTSSPGGIDCGLDCYEEYLPGTVVTLTAEPDAASTFLGWSGGCTGTGECVLTMTQDYHDVTATFGANVLTVTTTGDGSGVVSSDPPGITCGGGSADCAEAFAPGTDVTLTASPGDTSAFDGWSGDCAGAASCLLTITGDHAVTAAFDTGRVAVSTDGDGSGSVVSDPAGIDCPGDCSATFLPGTPVTLTASPGDAVSVLAEWSGDCTGTGSCAVNAGDDPSVTASFDTGRLEVDREGPGAGTVTSEPAGIDCGLDCREPYLPGTTVTLTATPQAGGTFAGWSGDCTGTGSCEVTLGDAAVVATFVPAGTGGKIVWDCAGNVCVMDADGSDVVNLTGDLDGVEVDPVLSPDGTRIAFATNSTLLEDNPDGNWELATINVDGSGLTQITVTDSPGSDPYHGNYDPSWSPDGSKITYASVRDSAFYQIFVINADGTGEVQLTPSDAAERTEPVWSPDGAKIAYTHSLGQSDVYSMNADGSGLASLTPGTIGSDDYGPAWSPDGTRVAFTTDRHYEPLKFNLDIYVARSDGTVPIRVTDDPNRDREPTWSPDGTQIAFSSSRGGTYDIWAVDAPPPERRNSVPIESGLRQLNDHPGADLEPFWGDETSTFLVTIKKTGTGAGLVKSKVDGIRCGADCAEPYPAGTKVKLVAKAKARSKFAGWSVPSCGTDRVCKITVTEPITVKAKFTSGAPIDRRLPR